MKKKDVNYRIIMGMHAVGKQCRDCDNSDTSSTICLVVDGKIMPSGSCNQFSRHYDDVPYKVETDKAFEARLLGDGKINPKISSNDEQF